MKPWSIRKRSTLINITTGVISVIVLLSVINFIVVSQLTTLENNIVHSNVKQVEATYKYMATLYEKKVIDWGAWDDTYQFIQDLNKKYISSNLDQSTLVNLTTDEILYYDIDANLKFATASPTILNNEPNFPEDTKNLFKENSELFNSILTGKKVSGLLRTDDGVLIFAGHPILHSDGTGTPRGIVVFGRYVGDWLPAELSKITQIPVAFDDNNKNAVSNNVYLSYISLPIDDRSGSLYLKVTTFRDVWLQGKKALAILLVSAAVIIVLSVIFTYLTLYRQIFLDISKFKEEVSLIAKNSGMGSISKSGITTDINELRQDVNSLLEILYKSKMQFQNKAEELDRINKMMVDREIRMVELKNLISDLKKKIV